MCHFFCANVSLFLFYSSAPLFIQQFLLNGKFFYSHWSQKRSTRLETVSTLTSWKVSHSLGNSLL